MLDPFLWFIALGPGALVAAGVVPGASTSARNRLAVGAALTALAIALVAAGAVMLRGSLRTQTVGYAGIGLAIYADSITAAMLCLVSFVGLIVVAYSRNYLHGDPGQSRFTQFLCLTLASVLFVIISGNLLAFTLAWIATSLGLHQLLVFYPERPAAVIAARKKFLVSRLGDLCLIAAMILLYRMFGSLDYAVLFSGVNALHATGNIPNVIQATATLLVCAALLKSAQFPLHGWLIEVMETPTPVSALLHAGIINAGGFLVLRFADVISLSLPSMNTLAIVGGLTALFGSVVMLTQTSIKVALAYSTIAQMGFMMLECGLFAFPAALLHILAHSVYKAHAFLSSGSVVDIARASWTPSPGGKPHPARLSFAIVGVLAVTFAVSRFFGATLADKPGVFVFGAVLMLGLIHLIANGIDERPNFYVVGRTLVFAGVVALVFFGLQFGAEWLVRDAVPRTQAARGPLEFTIASAVVLSFAIVTFLQGSVPRQSGAPRWQALYAHVSNGLYVNTLANRLVLRYWPRPPADPASLTVRG
jgi:NAD(P)H-quinone oxidoreductase subunit 5